MALEGWIFQDWLPYLIRKVDKGPYLDEHTMRDETPEISPNDAVPCCSGF